MVSRTGSAPFAASSSTCSQSVGSKADGPLGSCVWFRLLNTHKWERLQTRSEEAYRCRRCGKRYYGKIDDPEMGAMGGGGGAIGDIGGGAGGVGG
jgi:hypothetical protein